MFVLTEGLFVRVFPHLIYSICVASCVFSLCEWKCRQTLVWLSAVLVEMYTHVSNFITQGELHLASLRTVRARNQLALIRWMEHYLVRGSYLGTRSTRKLWCQREKTHAKQQTTACEENISLSTRVLQTFTEGLHCRQNGWEQMSTVPGGN